MLFHDFAVRSSFLLLAVVSCLTPCSARDEYQLQRSAPQRSGRGSKARNVTASYAPSPITCPPGDLVRPAVGLSTNEKRYIDQRKRLTTPALASWLDKVDPSFNAKNFTRNLPTIALVSSGGGYRSMLLGGGLIQTMDNRESNGTMAGLYQAFTYHSGLSGGAWLLSSIAGNDQAPISKLKQLWLPALVNNSLYPTHTDTSPDFPVVAKDISAKNAAGYLPTTADSWGRFIGIQMFGGPDGGVAKTMSGIAQTRSFGNAAAPYPIITALGVDEKDIYGRCDPVDNATQYEFTPYEFGSWDQGVKAFARTEILGTALSGGKPPSNSSCVRGYDNLSYVVGTSSNKFQEACGETTLAVIAATLEPITNAGHNKTRRDLYAPYPNPFKNYSGSPFVSSEPELFLVDGGQGTYPRLFL
jgi:lysophospholipase